LLIWKSNYSGEELMKIHFLLVASILALFVSGCANDSMMTDEEYDAAHSGPAPGSPDPMAHIQAPQNSPLGGTSRY
jgi:PBP1b-binding outer membrane lipoprotein LpoB